MHTKTPSVFSSFLRMKHTNPETYYSARTAKEMISAQKNLGSAFYDLNKKGVTDECIPIARTR